MEKMVCNAMKKQVTALECGKYSVIVGAKNFGHLCDGCTSKQRVCQYCILQGELKKHGQVKPFHVVQEGADACLFHNTYGASVTRQQAKQQKELDDAAREKAARLARRGGKRVAKPKVELAVNEKIQWITLRLKKEPKVEFGQRLKIKPHEIYVPSYLPSKSNEHGKIAELKQQVLRGVQEELLYVARYAGDDARYQYSLVAGLDMLLVCKDVGRCTMQVNLLHVPSRKQHFLLAMQLESYKELELRRVLKEARDFHQCSEQFLAKLLDQNTSWVKRQISLA